MPQFVDNVRDGSKLAIKFFLSRESFEAELKLYEDRVLHRFLVPASHMCSNHSSEVCSVSGYVFPPHYITERCEVRNTLCCVDTEYQILAEY
jgi:hypothetical protein